MYLHDLISLAGAVGISWALLRLIARTPLRRVVVEGVFASYVVAVAYVVFSVGGLGKAVPAYSWQQINLVPLHTILEFARSENMTRALRQIAGNIVLFVPLGVMLPMLTARLRHAPRVLVAAAATSTSIEILQLGFGLAGFGSRSSDIDDVILNTVGGVLGWAVWRGTFAGRPKLAPGRLDESAGEGAVREPA